ncbi:MAG TPA: type 2 lanthipeptide synthetase LanM family protein, partial [Chloroflexia bacterium]|nr:type 2 lanthipeptide synthetase LanM family protein [Chloroflexia bacterium]
MAAPYTRASWGQASTAWSASLTRPTNEEPRPTLLETPAISNSILTRIAEEASTIPERLAGSFAPRALPGNSDAAAARLARWREVVGKGDPVRFAERLASDGLDVAAVQPVLGAVCWPPGRPLPSWTATLQMVTGQRGPAPPLLPRVPDADALPFADAFHPFLQTARARLAVPKGPRGALLSAPAYGALDEQLRARLARLAARTLGDEFAAFRSARVQPDPRLADGELPRGQYVAFVAGLLDGGWAGLFSRYPVLARLTATITDLWVAATGEFLARLAADWTALQTHFHAGQPLTQAIAVAAGKSDMHGGGRSVCVVTFTEGLRLVYKPKNLGTERTFQDFLNWCSTEGAPYPFRVLTVLDRGTHGWVTFVEQAPCADRDAAARYYTRAGALLCVTSILAGTDCHQDNLIAAGEHPVLIDTEMLFYPPLRSEIAREAAGGAAELLHRRFLQSVLHTGMLPFWTARADGQAFDHSALGGIAAQESGFPVALWRDVNTDHMASALGYEAMDPPGNVARLDGTVLLPVDYQSALLDGFTRTYTFLQARRAVLGDPEGPLAAFADAELRFIFRSTRIYTALLARTAHPRFLVDGADWSIEMDVVSRALLLPDAPRACWPLLAHERAALAQRDVPLFTFRANSSTLVLEDGTTIPELFAGTGYERVISGLDDLGEADLAQQLEFIRFTLAARFAGERPVARPPGP